MKSKFLLEETENIIHISDDVISNDGQCLRFLIKIKHDKLAIIGDGFIEMEGARFLTGQIDYFSNHELCKHLVVDLRQTLETSGKYARIVSALTEASLKLKDREGSVELIVNKKSWYREKWILIEENILPKNKKDYPFKLEEVDYLHINAASLESQVLPYSHEVPINSDMKQELNGYEFEVLEVLPDSLKVNMKDAAGKYFEMFLNKTPLKEKGLDVPNAKGVFYVLEKNDGKQIYSEIYPIFIPKKQKKKKSKLWQTIKLFEESGLLNG